MLWMPATTALVKSSEKKFKKYLIETLAYVD